MVADLERAGELIAQYRDADLGLVDATIVAMAERLGVVGSYTLDRRDFGSSDRVTSTRSNSCPGSAPLALEVQERQLDDGGTDAPAAALDGPFDRELRAERLERGADGGERDRLLEDRAPAVARGAADLATAREDRDSASGRRRADRRRQALGVVQALDVVPIELEPDEPASRTAGPRLALEREPADEIALVEADEPPEPDLERASSSAPGSSRDGPTCSRPRAG